MTTRETVSGSPADPPGGRAVRRSIERYEPVDDQVVPLNFVSVLSRQYVRTGAPVAVLNEVAVNMTVFGRSRS